VGRELPTVIIEDVDGQPLALTGVDVISLGEPHICEHGIVHAPIIILAETERQLGVYFELNDADNIRRFAKGMLDMADQYEALLKAGDGESVQ